MLNEDPKTSACDPKMNEDPETSHEDPETSPEDPETSPEDPETSPGDPERSRGDPERQPTPPRGVWGRPRRSPTRTRLRNRRYAALRQLLREGDYFSEEAMRARDPLLYHHLVGRYRGPEPLLGDPLAPPNSLGGPPKASGCPPPPTLTELLLQQAEEVEVQQRLRQQREGEEEEEDSDSEDSEVSGSPPSPPERDLLRLEFVSRMHQRFLDGCDPHFDYSQVDENPELDNLDLESLDAEERYFDSEEPSAAPHFD